MNKAPHWTASVRTSIRGPLTAGLGAAILFLGGFSAWGCYAPLSGALVAEGVVVADGQNQPVQHLDGGILNEVHVREGQEVAAGQILVSLDKTQTRTQRDRLWKQIVGLKVRLAKAAAELDNRDIIGFPGALAADAEAAGVASLLGEQQTEFSTRLDSYNRSRSILRQRVAASNERVAGLTVQESALGAQLAIVEDETARKKQLLAKGLTNRSEYTQLLRSQAELVGNVGQMKASLLSTQAEIAEAREQYEMLYAKRIETASTESNVLKKDLIDAEEQLNAANTTLARTDIRAPSDGIVVKIGKSAPGSIVQAGETILEILPTREELLVETRIRPKDIDAVTIGEPVRLRFTALNARKTPDVPASLAYLSADRILDSDQKQAYYIARIRIGTALPPGIERSKIYPGMPVTAFIETGKRTFFDYLSKPILESFDRAFQEK